MSDHDIIIRDPEGGSNQSGLRDQNGRLVLTYLSRHGALSSAEIARRSRLSAQTVSNIIRALEADGLLARGEAVKGKVGKPSVPMALNPGGVYSLGISIGRRSAELVLIDFCGKQVDAELITYPFPSIETVFRFLSDSLAELLKRNPPVKDRIAGIGVARPNRIWDWLEAAGAPADAMLKWQELDLQRAIAEVSEFEVFIENDATSACVAEHLLGRGREFHDFAYIFVGHFVGGGLVLDGKFLSGQMLHASRLGPLPVPDEAGQPVQLLNVASLYTLEGDLKGTPHHVQQLRDERSDWTAFSATLEPWVAKTARNLAWASASIASVVEVEAILIDGAMPPNVREMLSAETNRAFRALETTGIEDVRIEQASVGRRARSIGAALLPIHSRFFLS